MIRSCIDEPTQRCSHAFIARAASSSAFSSAGPTRRSRLVSSFVLMVTPNRWNGEFARYGGFWKRPQLMAARSVPSARFTVATDRPGRYAALNRSTSLTFSSTAMACSPSTAFTASAGPGS